MASIKILGSVEWTAEERKFAAQLTLVEKEELVFPVVHHLEWLNEHIHEVLNTRKANLTKALKTPGKLKGRTPRTVRPPLTSTFTAAAQDNNKAPFNFTALLKQDFNVEPSNKSEADSFASAHETIPQARESITQEVVTHKTPDSTSSSPKPLHVPRLGSINFASLPPRDTLAVHVADDEEDWIGGVSSTTPKPYSVPPMVPARKSETVPTTNENFSVHHHDTSDDSDDNDAFSIDLRAPELIAHEQRMQQYASPDIVNNKAASTLTLVSPAKLATSRPPSPAKSISVSIPAPTTTPHTSPRRFMDAAKNRVHTALSSAKKLMAKSAGISAAAKMEAKAEYPDSPTPKPPKISNDMPGMYPSLDSLEGKPLPATPVPEPRRTRSSANREELQKQEKEKEVFTQPRVDMPDSTANKENERPEEPSTVQGKPQLFTKSLNGRDEPTRVRSRTTQKPLGKPVRPTAAGVAKSKPQPVSIKINALSSRMPVNTAPVAAHNQDVVRPELKRKASNQSMASATTSNIRNNPTQATSRVMQLAAKKKQQDELAAQKDAERKRRMKQIHNETRGEVAKMSREEEDERERKLRENSAEKRKHAAEIDNRETKRQKSEERQEREEAAAAAAKKAASLRVKQQKKLQKPTHAISAQPQHPPPRHPDRPPARNGFHAESEDEDQEETPTNSPRIRLKVHEPRESTQSQLPRLGASLYQSAMGKPKEQPEPELPPTYQSNLFKAAPLRSSNLGKKPSIFQTISQPAPPAITQFPQPPRNIPQMQQYAHQRIPFATQIPNAGSYATGPNTRPIMNQQVQQTIQTVQTVHTSPATDITLPEIHTDSSSDDDNGFQVPWWATPGHLNDTLAQQDAVVDPDTLFPAIQPIDMDSVFPNNRNRAHKMHVRTSSANWTRSGDGLTREEIDHDKAARQTIRNRGGWAYGH